MHEAFELSASIRGLRFREDMSRPEDGSINSMFIMTHKQMELVFADMAPLALGAFPMLIAEMKKLRKK